MKNIIAAFCFFIISSTLISSPKSDYATVQKFKEAKQEISKKIDIANSVFECAELKSQIEELSQEFEDEKSLIEKAVYPDGFLRSIEQLNSKLIIRQRDLGIIESQVVRITELETKVKELSGKIDALNADNEKLMSEIKSLSQTVKKLTGDLFSATTPMDSLRNLIVKLRDGLKQRDELIYALTDSLFLQYDKQVGDMNDVEKQRLMGKLEKHTIIGSVKKSIMDNVMFLESTQLKGNDLVDIVKQQKRFQSQWSGIAPKLASIYLQGKSKKYEVVTVDSMLAVWGDKVEDAMWRSLNSLLTSKGFYVKDFKNGAEFTSNLVNYIDEQIQNPTEETNDMRYKLFENFNDNIWEASLKNTWLPSMTELGKISEDNRKTIESKVSKWESSVSSGASWWVYALILIVVFLIPFVVIKVFHKSSKQTTEEQNV